MTSSQPRVSVIIPVRNNAPGLTECLRLLGAQTYPADDFEVIVVDNASTDDTPLVRAQFPCVRWFTDQGAGSYSARNCGLQYAVGAIIAFTDSDCLPDAGWLAQGVARVQDDPAIIAGGDVLHLDPPDRKLNVYEIFEILASGLPNIRHLIEVRGFAPTGNLFTSRAVFDRVGVFAAELKSGGDIEWVQRAVKAGTRLVFCPGAIVRHPRRSTFAGIALKYRRQIGGGVMLLRRSQPSFTRMVVYLCVYSPLDFRLYRWVFDPNITGFRIRVHFIWVILAMSCVATAEKFRVLLGGDPSRG